MGEIWRTIVSRGILFPGYEVSSLGNVRSFRRQKRVPGVKGTVSYIGKEAKLIKKIKKSIGYWCVNLSRDGKIFQRCIAPLVLEAFAGPRPERMEACHGQRGSFCDAIENLQWGTKSKNHGEDRIRDGSDVRGEKHGNSKLSNQQVAYIKGELSTGGRGVCTRLARECGVGRTTIAAIKYGNNWAWM